MRNGLFAAPYLTLMKEDAPQRNHSLREVFNGLRRLVRSGARRRMMPNGLPPRPAVCQQTKRWLAAGVFDESRLMIDGGTTPPASESGGRAGHDGYKRRNGSEIHMAAGTPGLLPALHLAPADEQERAQAGKLAEEARAVANESVNLPPKRDGLLNAAPLGLPVSAGWPRL